MAQVALPKVTLGNVALPSGYGILAKRFSINESQAVEDVTPFGSNACTRNIGSGTPDYSFSVSGVATSASNPGFGQAQLSGNDGTGATPPQATFTVTTGITFTGPVVIGSTSMDEERTRPGVPVTISGKNAGDWVVAWSGS